MMLGAGTTPDSVNTITLGTTAYPDKLGPLPHLIGKVCTLFRNVL
jgi:hypothetical protein